MSKIKDENYFSIHGWMVNRLKLKGNELIIYSIIYGFSQIDNQVFSGSLQYLADFTNSTKQGVIKNLKSLVEKGFINKKEIVKNGVKTCQYYVTEFNGSIKQSLTGCSTEFNGGIKQSLTNNINNNNKDNNNNNIYSREIEKNIIDYLNKKLDSNYKYDSKKTTELIKARLNQGFKEEDFYKVIDKKYNEWNDSEMAIYLRPTTLFGTKFEDYLNQKEVKKKFDIRKVDWSKF